MYTLRTYCVLRDLLNGILMLVLCQINKMTLKLSVDNYIYFADYVIILDYHRII